ncbi:(Fe-S)-binding protein [Synechococcus sp. WH 8101]|uniref:(Fe-S)-binding protein n=1 Tax=Synechococcus sp. WH 8101 TaxID=59932 RepID=UPI001022EF4D|nr:(Fe-S)-binding protein [Synechococcus sp. WH 8101]QBE67793.1 (Fe-S)-binding protein [Synechococcus sp. WH 8101]QNI43989.1 glycolate oxidase iron-sulfur subunit [Synechococcus sp. WH 8101]
MAIADPTDPCIHCGFCLPTCASYRVLGTEMDSPRGRIHTLKAIEAGELSLDATVASHFDSCLGCFACVSACPSGVRYDQLIEATRPKLNTDELRSPWQQSFRQLLLAVLPYPKRLRALLTPLRAYAGGPLQTLARRAGLPRWLGPQLEAMEALLPPLAAEGFRDRFPLLNPARGERRGRVGLVLGCVQRCFDPDVNQATVAVLQANGFEVVIPADQGCCGAVSHHQGQLEQTRELASELVRSFSTAAGVEGLDAVLVAASGCGHTMKAYGELLNEGQSGFPYPVLDVHEFLAARGLSDAFRRSLQPLPIAVAYHDACHMIHGQGITAQPRQLLRAIPELELREATEVGVCCGSAGIYNLVQPAEAAELGQIKAQDLSGTGASVIASANIGCSLQLRRHLEVDGPEVLHPMQLLARSTGLSAPQSDCPPGEQANQRISAERRRSIA